MWDSTCNADTLIADVKGEINKDLVSKGSWKDDYIGFCTQFNVFPCPFFVSGVNENGGKYVRLSHTIVDVSSWRAFLLACAASTIGDISIQAVQLNPSQIQELALLMEKLGALSVLKLDNMYMNQAFSVEEYGDAYVSLFANSFQLEYLSLKGNKLSDSFAKKAAPVIASNYCLKSLNLSDNSFTDEGMQTIILSLKTNISIERISLRNNMFGESSASALQTILIGVAPLAEDEAYFKNLGKQIGDRNKAIKETNKKRKKANLLEFPEISLPADRIVKIAGQSRMLNKVCTFVDVSHGVSTRDLLRGMCVSVDEQCADSAYDFKVVVLAVGADAVDVGAVGSKRLEVAV